MKANYLISLLLLACALPVQAEAYKCRQPDGSTQISSEPCAGGSSTVKAVHDEAVPEASREQAERDAERMRQRADQMQRERRADEVAERKDQERQRQASGAPEPAAIQHCLQTLNRMSVDSNQRSELEAGCYASGTIQPVFVQSQPYYGGTYVRPRHPHYQPLPEPQPKPLPQKPGNQVNPVYNAPNNYRAR